MNKNNLLTIYYAHHRWKYGTQIEAYELDLIRKYYPLADIFNPSEHLDVEGKSEEEIMKDCLSTVRDSDIVIFSSMDGVIGKGVYEELMEAKRNNKPIMYIHYDTIISDIFEIGKFKNSSKGDRTYAAVHIDNDSERIFEMVINYE